MLKINKNPEKIRKTADKHRGMRRSDVAKKNMSNARKELYRKEGAKPFGGGMSYMYNPETKEIKRISKDDNIPNGWVSGTGPKNKASYKGLNKGSVFAHHKDTKVNKRFKSPEHVPKEYVLGRYTKPKI